MDDPMATKLQVLGETSVSKDSNSRIELSFSTLSQTTKSTAINGKVKLWKKLFEKKYVVGNCNNSITFWVIATALVEFSMQFNNLKHHHVTYKE